MNEKINFFVPDFWNKYTLNTMLINTLRDEPELFYDNIKIGAVYGSFPECIWNGGRTMVGEDPGALNISRTIDTINSLGIPVRFTWSNCVLTEEHIHDPLCNYVMECANNGMNEVIINSPILEEYLREKYPNFKYISSTTKCILDEKEILGESDKYYLTVLDYRKNSDLKFLKSLKNKDKYELLINAYCNPNCDRRAEHYKILSELQLHLERQEPFCETFGKTIYDVLKYPSVIKENDLYKVYNKQLGFNNFKIEGRNYSTPDTLECYIYYMVKSEYKDILRLRFLRGLC